MLIQVFLLLKNLDDDPDMAYNSNLAADNSNMDADNSDLADLVDNPDLEDDNDSADDDPVDPDILI